MPGLSLQEQQFNKLQEGQSEQVQGSENTAEHGNETSGWTRPTAVAMVWCRAGGACSAVTEPER